MAERERIAMRRGCATIDTHWPRDTALGYAISYGAFDGRRVAEIFIAANKASSDSEAVARDAAIVVSIALQYGAGLDTLRAAITRDGAGNPLSVIGHALDLVALDMAGESEGPQ